MYCAYNPVYHDNDLFIQEVIKIHGDVLEFPNLRINGMRNKINVECKVCGHKFSKYPNDLINGKRGCPVCAMKKRNVGLSANQEHFLERVKSNRTDKGLVYDYSKVRYKNMKTKVEIVCKKHGPFWQTPLNHINNHDCPLCGTKRAQMKNSSDTEKYLEKIKIKRYDHGKTYDYSRVQYINIRAKIEIICPEHGSFFQLPGDHLRGCGCPICNESLLEAKTQAVLEDLQIKFEPQKRFDWLGRQSLDFYLPDFKIAIECQGIQHYKNVEYFGNALEKTQKLDYIKRQACYRHNIKVAYIRYDEKDVLKKITKILDKQKAQSKD